MDLINCIYDYCVHSEVNLAVRSAPRSSTWTSFLGRKGKTNPTLNTSEMKATFRHVWLPSTLMGTTCLFLGTRIWPRWGKTEMEKEKIKRSTGHECSETPQRTTCHKGISPYFANEDCRYLSENGQMLLRCRYKLFNPEEGSRAGFNTICKLLIDKRKVRNYRNDWTHLRSVSTHAHTRARARANPRQQIGMKSILLASCFWHCYNYVQNKRYMKW